jgi:hypothetical protein
LLGQVTRVFHAAALGRQDQLGTKGFHGLHALDGQVLRHDEHHAVALDGGSHGQRNAGVARGGLDQRVARLDVATLLGPLNHGQGRAVFDRTRRVIAFQLAQHHVLTGCVVGRTDALQGHQWGFSDRIFNSGVVHALNVP